MLAVFVSCNKNEAPDSGDEEKTEMDARLKDIWKVSGFRMAGANLSNVCPISYLILDPENGNAALMTKEMKEDGNVLFISPNAAYFIGEIAEQEPGSHEFSIELQRNLTIEAKVKAEADGGIMQATISLDSTQ